MKAVSTVSSVWGYTVTVADALYLARGRSSECGLAGTRADEREQQAQQQRNDA